MERVLINTPATLSKTFEEDGAPVDPGTVTVTVTRADGTQVATGTAGGSGPAARTFTLAVASTGLLDTLTVAWASVPKGTLTSTVEIVGGFLFTLSEAQALVPGAAIDDLKRTRLWAEDELERACRTAFVPRYTRETRIARHGRLRLPRANVRTIRTVTVDGRALTTPEIAQLLVIGQELHGYWWPRRAAVTIGYEHGYDTPPEGIHQAALELVEDQLTDASGIDPRAESIITEDGTIRLASAGETFGIPSIDRAVRAHREPLVA